jgi:hypothetical protein
MKDVRWPVRSPIVAKTRSNCAGLGIGHAGLFRLREIRHHAPSTEVHAVALETRDVAGVIEVEFGGRNVIDGVLVVALAHRVLVPGPLRALELALGGLDGDLREVRLLLAGEELAADLDFLVLQRGVQAVEGGLFSLVFVA